MLKIYCVYWGDKYARDYVYVLKRMVGRCLSQPFEFICITDQNIHGITCKKPVVDYHGWWQKIGLFAPGFAPGPAIYLDLDVVVCGFIDIWRTLLSAYTDEQMAMPKNWARSGHGGWQSSVMIWNTLPVNVFDNFDYYKHANEFYGDQEYLTDQHKQGLITCNVLGGVYSYKYHCRNQCVPLDVKVVAFHGEPKPHEVNDQWVRMARY